MTTVSSKSELRKQRKASKADGCAFERGVNGELEMVLPRSPAAERKHARVMDRWARRYEALNGAPESHEDL